MKRLVVFDLDGTLVDSTRDIATAFARTVRRLDPNTTPLPTDVVRSLIGNGARNLVERGLRRLGLPDSSAEALPLFLVFYRECLLDETRLYPGTEATLRALHGRRLAVLTNKPGALSRLILDGLGVASLFERVIGGDDGPPSKPDPTGLRQLMTDVGATPETTLMVGDSPVDVATARAAGVPIAGVAYGLDPAGLAAAAPDFTVRRPEQLLELC